MKTFKELKDIIEDCIDWDDVMYEVGSAKYNEAWKELEAAYEKQIAKKPIWHNDTTYLKCPVCGSFDIGDGYCGDCGQKIDWREE